MRVNDLPLRPYLLRSCYSAQVEAVALVNVRLRYTCFGLAYPAAWQALRASAWGWRTWFPMLSIEFAVEADHDVWYPVRLRIGRSVLTWSRARNADASRVSSELIGLSAWRPGMCQPRLLLGGASS